MQSAVKIKKHPNKNEYLFAQEGIWVRNLCKPVSAYIDINTSMSEDYELLLTNELTNTGRIKSRIDAELRHHKNVVIVSDGLDFKAKHRLLSKLDPKVAVIAVNGALAKWELVGDKCPYEDQRSINYYVVNNPYKECSKFLPKHHKYYPRCLSSTRTSPEFLDSYFGDKILYSPVSNQNYTGPITNASYKIDDYHDPICAALALSFRFGAEKILLLCCDDSFRENRPASVQIEEGLWTYPQLVVAQKVIDANLHWLKQCDIKIGDHSQWSKMRNATYITEDKVANFFTEA